MVRQCLHVSQLARVFSILFHSCFGLFLQLFWPNICCSSGEVEDIQCSVVVVHYPRQRKSNQTYKLWYNCLLRINRDSCTSENFKYIQLCVHLVYVQSSPNGSIICLMSATRPNGRNGRKHADIVVHDIVVFDKMTNPNWRLRALDIY